MHTYILARDLVEMPRLFDMTSKCEQVVDCTQIAAILFRIPGHYEERLLSIPVVNMWVGHELAFLEYWKVFVDDLHEVAVEAGLDGAHEIADNSREKLDTLYSRAWDSAEFSMDNPLVTVSDNFIFQNWIEYIRCRPDRASMRPDAIDLSVPFVFDWNV